MAKTGQKGYESGLNWPKLSKLAKTGDFVQFSYTPLEVDLREVSKRVQNVRKCLISRVQNGQNASP